MKKLMIVLGMLVWAGSFSGAQEGDNYEPNDSPEDFYTLPGVELRLEGLTLTENDADWFGFTLSEARFLKIGTESDMDTVITVYGPGSADEVFTQNDDWTMETYDALVQAYFSRAGTYYIKVESYNNGNAGPYTLFLSPVDLSLDSGEPNNDRSGARILDLASLPRSFLLFPGGAEADRDWFVLDFSSLYLGENEGLVIYTAGGTDTHMTLYRGDEVFTQNDDFTDYNARISFIPRRGDTYYLELRGYDESSVGEYRLCAETRVFQVDAYEPNDSPVQATLLEAGTVQRGHTLSETDHTDYFSFTVPYGGNYIIGTSGGVDTLIELYNESANDSAPPKTDDDSGEGFNALLIAYLEPGNYHVKVSRYDDRDEAYAIFLAQWPGIGPE